MCSVMTGSEAKTPIRGKNYIQGQKDDYVQVMADLSDACEREVEIN